MCFFCGTRKADSKEHAMPLWLQPYLDEIGGGRFQHHHEDSDGTRTREWAADAPDIQVRQVCGEHCNSGWMSDLESKVQPFIGSVIKGNGRTYYRAGQQLIAFWSVKTALMFEFALDGQFLPTRWGSELYERRSEYRPPERVQIWIGSCQIPGVGFFRSNGLDLTRPSGEKVGGYGVTFTIGRLVVQIFGHEFEGEPGGVLREAVAGSRLEKTMLQIWPYVGEVKMPPPHVLNKSELDALSDAFVGGI